MQAKKRDKILTWCMACICASNACSGSASQPTSDGRGRPRHNPSYASERLSSRPTGTDRKGCSKYDSGAMGRGSWWVCKDFNVHGDEARQAACCYRFRFSHCKSLRLLYCMEYVVSKRSSNRMPIQRLDHMVRFSGVLTLRDTRAWAVAVDARCSRGLRGNKRDARTGIQNQLVAIFATRGHGNPGLFFAHTCKAICMLVERGTYSRKREAKRCGSATNS